MSDRGSIRCDEEPAASDEPSTDLAQLPGRWTVGPVEIPAGLVFVMADNRGSSADSRVIGAVEVNTIASRAIARIWPPDRTAFL